jgi:hypothetical protein
MTQQREITAFLNTHVLWPQAGVMPGTWDGEFPWVQSGYPLLFGARPSVDELADELLGNAEFRALQLGTCLGTTDGSIIAEAVEMVLPPLYGADVQLLVAALQRAAQLQQQEGQRAAGRGVLYALGAAVVLAGLIAAARDAR